MVLPEAGRAQRRARAMIPCLIGRFQSFGITASSTGDTRRGASSASISRSCRSLSGRILLRPRSRLLICSRDICANFASCPWVSPRFSRSARSSSPVTHHLLPLGY